MYLVRDLLMKKNYTQHYQIATALLSEETSDEESSISSSAYHVQDFLQSFEKCLCFSHILESGVNLQCSRFYTGFFAKKRCPPHEANGYFCNCRSLMSGYLHSLPALRSLQTSEAITAFEVFVS